MPQTMPFDFLLQYLPGTIIVKPAIGMFYLYYNGKIVLIARRTVKNPQHNGLWIATEREHHESLKRELPAIGISYLKKEAKSRAIGCYSVMRMMILKLPPRGFAK